jgi:hypothetical protein
VIHAASIKAKGEWIRGVIDPASAGASKADGKQVIKLYHDQGLKLTPADNSVEAGINGVWQRISTGRLKVFRSRQSWITEYRVYRRTEQGKMTRRRWPL